MLTLHLPSFAVAFTQKTQKQLNAVSECSANVHAVNDSLILE